MGQIHDDTGEESTLGYPQQRACNVELSGCMNETYQEGAKAPAN
jgi:hypothetical protein